MLPACRWRERRTAGVTRPDKHGLASTGVGLDRKTTKKKRKIERPDNKGLQLTRKKYSELYDGVQSSVILTTRNHREQKKKKK